MSKSPMFSPEVVAAHGVRAARHRGTPISKRLSSSAHTLASQCEQRAPRISAESGHVRPVDGRLFGAAGALGKEQMETPAESAAPEDLDPVGFEDLVFVPLDAAAVGQSGRHQRLFLDSDAAGGHGRHRRRGRRHRGPAARRGRHRRRWPAARPCEVAHGRWRRAIRLRRQGAARLTLLRRLAVMRSASCRRLRHVGLVRRGSVTGPCTRARRTRAPQHRRRRQPDRPALCPGDGQAWLRECARRAGADAVDVGGSLHSVTPSRQGTRWWTGGYTR